MKLFKKKRYYFSDDSIATDTVISLILAVICLLIEIISIVFSFVTRGHIPSIFGTLYLCAIIMSVTGIVFAFFGYSAPEGGMKSKWFSMVLNIVALLVIGGILLLGIR